jgi:hypothetical protein
VRHAKGQNRVTDQPTESILAVKAYEDHSPGNAGALQGIHFAGIHVGDLVTRGFSIGNTAPAGAKSLFSSVTGYGGPPTYGVDPDLSGTAYSGGGATLLPGEWKDYTVTLKPTKTGHLDQGAWIGVYDNPNTSGVAVPITADVVNYAQPEFVLTGLDADDKIKTFGNTTVLHLHRVGPEGHEPIGITIKNAAPGPADLLSGFVSGVYPEVDGIVTNDPQRFGNVTAGGQVPLMTATVDTTHKGPVRVGVGVWGQSFNEETGTLVAVPSGVRSLTIVGNVV